MIFFEVIIKNKKNIIKKRNVTENKKNSSDSDDSMPALQSVSEDDSEYDSEDSQQVRWKEKPRASLTYRASKLIPLSTSPEWDEINASLNIHLTGPDSLMGLCDEAHFARSHLKKTMSALLKGSKQSKAALFCLKQIQSEDITEDLQIAFAKLLPHSLLHAEQLPELRTAIQQLRTQHLIYERLPMGTRKAITDYLPSTSGTAAQTVPDVSSTPPRPSETITKSSTQVTSQKPSTPLNSSTACRTGQKSSSTAQSPPNASSEHVTPSQSQPVSRTSQTQLSPSASQSTASRPSSLSTTVQKHSAVSQAPKEPSNDSQPATPDPESSTARGLSTTSQNTLGPPHSSESSTSFQGFDGSQHRQGPSRPRKRGKGRRK